MKTARSLVLLLCGLAATPALAAQPPVPPVEVRDHPVVTGTGKAPTASDVRAAIARGAAVRGWALSEVAPNAFDATLSVRKHRVVARIDYGADKFSITYRASENMGFEVVNGRPFIHPKYNQWVNNLLADIRKELTTL